MPDTLAVIEKAEIPFVMGSKLGNYASHHFLTSSFFLM